MAFSIIFPPCLLNPDRASKQFYSVMSPKLQTAMASRLRDEIKPRRFDLTMSRRTRRPAAATLATSCHEQDHRQAVDVEGLGFQPVVQPERQDPGLFCLSDHLQPRQPEDAHQEHETSVQRSEDTTKEQASPLRTCHPEKKDVESEAQQHQLEEEEYQDNSRRFSLQELIEDEAVDDGVKDAATGSMHMEENAAAGSGGVREVAEGAAVAGAEKRLVQQVAGRRVIGMMRRYVKVRSTKRASPEKNAAPQHLYADDAQL